MESANLSALSSTWNYVTKQLEIIFLLSNLDTRTMVVSVKYFILRRDTKSLKDSCNLNSTQEPATPIRVFSQCFNPL